MTAVVWVVLVLAVVVLGSSWWLGQRRKDERRWGR